MMIQATKLIFYTSFDPEYGIRFTDVPQLDSHTHSAYNTGNNTQERIEQMQGQDEQQQQ